MYVHDRIRNKTLTEDDIKNANFGWYNVVRFEWEDWLEQLGTIKYYLKDDPPSWLLHRALSADNVDSIKWCFENVNCDVNNYQVSICLRPTKVEVVLLLIQHGLQLTSELFDERICCHPRTNLDIIDLLLEMKCPYTDECLYSALKWNNIELYHHLLKKGVKWARNTIKFTFHSDHLLLEENLEYVLELFSKEGIVVTECIHHDIYAGERLHWTKEKGYLY